MSGKSISFINDKGGVTKSTSAVCLSDYLMHQGYTVCLVDVDARHSCLDWAELANQQGHKTPLMVGNSHTNVGTEIEKLKQLHDYVVVDGMSSFVNTGRKELIASIIKNSDYIFIPTQPNPFDLWALSELSDIIKARQSITDGLPPTYLYGALVREGVNEWAEFLETKDQAPFPILDFYIPLAAEFARTTGKGSTPYYLSENNKSRIALLKWADSIMEKVNE